MTETVSHLPDATASSVASAPRRATLVVLASVFLVVYVIMLATGSDLEYDAELSDIAAGYDQSLSAIRLASYVGMAFVGLLLFFGAALRNAVRAWARTWLVDVTLLGFAALSATIASWFVMDFALWKAVDHGDEAATRALVALSDAAFLPFMAGMVAAYLGTGLAGLVNGALPKWLAIASIAVGVTAPVGPLGFVGTTLLPLWMLAIALTVRLSPRG